MHIICRRSSWKWPCSPVAARTLAGVLAWALFAQLALAAAHAQAPSPEYQQLIDRGLAAYAAQRPADARKLFSQAHALQPGARTLRALGIADLALDNYTMAKDELQASLKERALPLSDTQRAEVQELLHWMQSNLGTLHLSFTPLSAEAKIDGRAVKDPEVLLAPEEHKLTVSARGFVPQERTFTVTIDRPMKLQISLEPAPAPLTRLREEAHKPAPELQPMAAAETTAPLAESTQPVAPSDDAKLKLWPWLGGAGAVLLVAGGTMFAFGMSDKATVEDTKTPVRLSEIEAAHDRVPWLTGVGLSLGIAGLAGIGAATVLLLIEPREHDDVAWSIKAGPTQLSMTGRF